MRQNNNITADLYYDNPRDEQKFRQNMQVIRPFTSDHIWNYFLNSQNFTQFVNSLMGDLVLLNNMYCNSTGYNGTVKDEKIKTEMKRIIEEAYNQHYNSQ